MVMRHALARRPLKINASCHGLMRPGQPRHAGGISSSSPTLYCESNCDLYSERGREAHRNTRPATRLCMRATRIKLFARSPLCTTFLQNGLDVPAQNSRTSPAAFQNHSMHSSHCRRPGRRARGPPRAYARCRSQPRTRWLLAEILHHTSPT